MNSKDPIPIGVQGMSEVEEHVCMCVHTHVGACMCTQWETQERTKQTRGENDDADLHIVFIIKDVCWQKMS